MSHPPLPNPTDTPGEAVSTLLETDGWKVERIDSFGHVNPPGFWYDQEQDEWVVVVRGTATLGWGDGRSEELKTGDWRLIPAHERHRVDRTDPETVWLAVHFPAAT